MQQRAHDAPHVRVIVDHEKPQAIEIDANHGTSAVQAGELIHALQ
jgi:hypothetical protein